MKYHPDHDLGNKGVEDKFKGANETYETLFDASKWVAYDQYDYTGAGPNIGGGAGVGFGGTSFSDILGDMFGDLFGGGGARGSSHGGARRGTDLHYTLDLNLEEVVCGTAVTIHVSTLIGCRTCNGSDAKPGITPVTYTTCGGIDQIRMQQGFFSVQQTCPRCHDTGKMISDPYGPCHGQGRVEEQKTLSVKVPAGADTGDHIRFIDEGEAGSMGGPVGDLYVVVDVREHPISQRDGKHLYCEVPISFANAALSGELEMPILDDRAKPKIPESIRTGKLFHLRGKGVAPVHGGDAGDLMCKVVAETPVNPDKRQCELLEKFRKSLQSDTSHLPKASDWFEGMKRFFDDL